MISIAGGWQNSRSRAWRTCLSSVLSFTESMPISPLPVQDFRRKRSAHRSSKEQPGQAEHNGGSIFFSYTDFIILGQQNNKMGNTIKSVIPRPDRGIQFFSDSWIVRSSRTTRASRQLIASLIIHRRQKVKKIVVFVLGPDRTGIIAA